MRKWIHFVAILTLMSSCRDENFESLNNLTSSINNMSVTLAVLIGGIWTLYTFYKTQQTNKAKSEIQLLELKLKVQPAVSISISTSQVASINEQKIFEVEVVLSNSGSKDAIIHFYEEPLKMATIFKDADEAMQLANIKSIKYKNINIDGPKYLRLRHGIDWKFKYLVKINNPGIYYLQYRVPVNNEGNERVTDQYEIDRIMKDAHWFGEHYFSVS